MMIYLYHRPRLIAMRAMVARSAVAILAFVAAPASAQLSDAFLASPSGKRLTPQERADIDLTQITPDFRLHREWMHCINEMAGSLLAQGATVERTAKIVAPVCEGGESVLRASLAQSIGLPRARHVIEVLWANRLMEFKLAYERVLASKAGDAKLVNGWRLEPTEKFGCLAAHVQRDGRSVSSRFIFKGPEGYSLAILDFDGEGRLHGPDQPVTNTIILWNHLSATQFGEQVFTPMVTTKGNGLSTPLGPELLRLLPGYDKLQRGTKEIIDITGIIEVIAAMDKCRAPSP